MSQGSRCDEEKRASNEDLASNAEIAGMINTQGENDVVAIPDHAF